MSCPTAIPPLVMPCRPKFLPGIVWRNCKSRSKKGVIFRRVTKRMGRWDCAKQSLGEEDEM